MDPKRVDKIANRRRIRTNSSSVVADSKYIAIEDNKEMETHINDIWDELRNLGNKTTKSVKEAELTYGRNHKNRVASMIGEVGQFRLKEISKAGESNAIEICGPESWQSLSARMPNLSEFKVENPITTKELGLALNTSNTYTDAAVNTAINTAVDIVIKDTNKKIIDLQTKYNNLLDILSNLNIFNLEDIPDENPNADRDVAARKAIKSS